MSCSHSEDYQNAKIGCFLCIEDQLEEDIEKLETKVAELEKRAEAAERVVVEAREGRDCVRTELVVENDGKLPDEVPVWWAQLDTALIAFDSRKK